MFRKTVLSLFTALSFASSVLAANYTIDDAHSKAIFKIKHLGISTVTGQFSDVKGNIEFEDFFKSPKAASGASTKAEIKIASINTGIAKRDEHLKSKEFFDTEQFPLMTFVSKSVKVTGDKTFDIYGDLTMHGVTKPVVLKAIYEGKEKDPFTGKEKIAFTATTKINRKDFGLSWNKALESGSLVVGEEVSISLEIEAVAS